jgi:hypothetical protein
MKRFITSVALLVCTMLMTGSFVQLVADTGWKEKIIPGVYEEVPESQQGSSEFMPFRCYPPWDSFCARILWKPLDKDGRLQASSPDASSRVALWIPSKGLGYTDVRINGVDADPLTQSVMVQFTGTNGTQVVNTIQALERWVVESATP